jgi:poly(U)-specific endoribonuclease
VHGEDGDVVLDLQVQREHVDATRPLFKFVNPSVLKRPTFRALLDLRQMYNPQVDEEDTMSNEKEGKVYHFLEEIMNTSVMRYLHNYLLDSERTTALSNEDFMSELFNKWFKPYYRGGTCDSSSGFEHVFLGELRDGNAIGMHNWIIAYAEELDGNFKFHYCIDATRRLITINSSWHGSEKPVNAFFVGTTPEFDFAMYTMVFYNNPDGETPVSVNKHELFVTTDSWDDTDSTFLDSKMIATVYPHNLSNVNRSRGESGVSESDTGTGTGTAVVSGGGAAVGAGSFFEAFTNNLSQKQNQ